MKTISYIIIATLSFSLGATVKLYRGTAFRVPRTCKKLAILGSTPHPTQFLANGGNIHDLKKINLQDFLDMEYLCTSWRNTLQLCMHNNIDHLLVTYLPGHFVAQRQAYPLPIYEREMYSFLRRIAAHIVDVIRATAHELGCIIPITLIVPPRSMLKAVPEAFDSDEHRIQHYIRSLPRLKGIAHKPLHIAIINNRGSDQNEAIMRYLSYEYILQAPLRFSVLELEKEKFHVYI